LSPRATRVPLITVLAAFARSTPTHPAPARAPTAPARATPALRATPLYPDTPARVLADRAAAISPAVRIGKLCSRSWHSTRILLLAPRTWAHLPGARLWWRRRGMPRRM